MTNVAFALGDAPRLLRRWRPGSLLATAASAWPLAASFSQQQVTAVTHCVLVLPPPGRKFKAFARAGDGVCWQMSSFGETKAFKLV